MKVLYCDCFSGISGDMLLGALIDAGLPVEVLDREFHKLALPEYISMGVEQVVKQGQRASHIRFILHGDAADTTGLHSHGRHLSEIRQLIQQSRLAEGVKETALRIFGRLAQAEAKVHGTPVEKVHFHEVGAVDSILDICGICIGLNHLQIDQVFSSPIPIGSGSVQTDHGLLPLPAPATLELLQSVSAPTIPSTATVELVTPTGMAILAELAQFVRPAMQIKMVGVGAGTRELPWANILRVMIGETDHDGSEYVMMETNLDDMTPQALGHLLPGLLSEGALDVYFTPIQMKKNRPAIKLSLITRQVDEHRLADILLRETSTFGVRVYPVHRYEADREIRVFATSLGDVRVKCKILDGTISQIHPEYDDAARIADEQKIPLARVYQIIQRDLESQGIMPSQDE